jgi:hypothetical protein
MKTKDKDSIKLNKIDHRKGTLEEVSKKYNSNYHPKCAKALARLGLKNYQIYILLDISEPTGVSWYRKIDAFNLAIKEGRADKVDFNFAPVCGEIELRELLSESISRNKELEEQIEQLKNELNIKYRPVNPEREKQLRYLRDIEERQKPTENEVKKAPIEPKHDAAWEHDFRPNW